MQSLAEIINQKNFNNIDDVKDFTTDYIKQQSNIDLDNEDELDELVSDCISNFYILEIADDYIAAFEDHPFLADSMIIDIINDLAVTLARLTLKVKDCYGNKQLIKDIITESVRELYKFDKFEQCFADADTAFIFLPINNIGTVIDKIFINENNINRINKALRNVKQSEVDLISNALELINIDELNIDIGQEKPLDEAFFNRLCHSSQFKPIIYINGNVISSKDTPTGKERNHHSLLYDGYFNNEELHKHDIIKMPMEEWKKVKYEDIYKYHGVSAVIQTKNACTINGLHYTQEAADAINKEFGCKVFGVYFSDNPEDLNKIRRFAKKY